MIDELKKELIKLSEEKYKQFSSKLIPNIDNILGIRLPTLRQIAKRIAKNDYLTFLKENDDEFFELTMLEGMIIGYLSKNEQLKYIENFIPKINNWAVCDSFCSGIKKPQKLFLEKYFKSNKEYENRFAFVCLLNYFIDDDYEYVIEKIKKFNSEKYYAKMAVAWCLSICIIKNYKQAIADIQKNEMNIWVKNKGITKAIESKRLNAAQKEELKKLRKNN